MHLARFLVVDFESGELMLTTDLPPEAFAALDEQMQKDDSSMRYLAAPKGFSRAGDTPCAHGTVEEFVMVLEKTC